MPSLHRPRVLSLNFFNRDNNRDSTAPLSQATRRGHSNSFNNSPERAHDEPGAQVAREAPTATPITARASRADSRTASMVYAWTPPTIGNGQPEQIEELMPVFSFLSSHSNKLYQEGYFLKLNDLDTSGKPNVDRAWTECFAQLVGTVLSLWDATALDAAGQDGEVAPTFVNLADASIKMIETLPTRNQDVQPLQNVLSISTAGKNRYLLHFNSLHSLTQWTAGIRLAMFEHASLQELYTGSLIAGKGKHLNNIRTIMERSKYVSEDWARVRFGAGTPWRRCWCVITPPDEREFQKQQQKSLKKRSAYERPAVPKGDIKFYDTKKTKRAVPIATITDAYSAYAIYPQSKPLIEQSTLVKVEGRITIHSDPESKTEGFVFVMPEVHPAVSGFEMMLRWLFPVYDTFTLYGRPNRLIADTLDTRGIMFAMPKERRYGYLDIIDVAGLIHTVGSDRWSEREWRRQLKDLTSKRMSMAAQGRTSSTLGSNRVPRTSIGSRNGNGVTFGDNASIRSTPSTRGHRPNQSTDAVFATPTRVGTAPSAPYLNSAQNYHNRSASESLLGPSPNKSRRSRDGYRPSRLSIDQETNEQQPLPLPRDAPRAPVHQQPQAYPAALQNSLDQDDSRDSRNSSDSDLRIPRTNPEEVNRDVRQLAAPTPVVAPPTFQHQPGEQPRARPNVRPEMRRENSRLSTGTMSQLVDASKMNGVAAAGATAAWRSREGEQSDAGPRGVGEIHAPTTDHDLANHHLADEGVVAGTENAGPVPPRPSLQTRQSSERPVHRKPLPRTASEQSVTRKPINAHISPLADPPIDQDRADQAGPSANLSHEPNTEALSRQSLDNYSTESPDYSSRKSLESNEVSASEKSIPRPRTGVLKTVGDPSLSAYTRYQASDNDIPNVDFGPTQRLTTMPGTGHNRQGSLMGRKSPLAFFDRPSTSPTPEAEHRPRSRLSKSRPVHERSTSYTERPRSMLWQPALTAAGAGRQSPSPGPGYSPGISAEEFVRERAAAASGPTGYVPRRNMSSPTLDRPSSSLAMAKRESYTRPNSRGASQMMTQEVGTNLSAREQEYVSRMTGSPLVNVAPRSRTPDPNVGLVGAIEAREQERRDVKAGLAGQMVREAVGQRLREQQAQTQAQTAYGAGAGQGYYSGTQYPDTRNMPISPPPGYAPTMADPRQSGQWTNSQAHPQAQVYWAGQQQQNMHYQNQNHNYDQPGGVQYDPRYTGYYEAPGNSGRR